MNDVKDVQIAFKLRWISLNFPSGLPGLEDNETEEELNDLKQAAEKFRLPYLSTICDNVTEEQDFLNPSIGTYLNDETGAKLKSLFFNRPTHADVVFNVEGKNLIKILSNIFWRYFFSLSFLSVLSLSWVDSSLGSSLTH